jgi:hypothetical protein
MKHSTAGISTARLVSTRQRFRSKAGIAVGQDITQVLQLRDGRVLYATGYRDRANALKAVGLAG